MGGGFREFAGVGVRQPRRVAGKLHHCHLHSQADTEEGERLLPGVLDGGDHPLYPPAAEAAGDDDPGTASQSGGHVVGGKGLRVHPPDIHLHVVLDPAVGEGLHHREVGVVEGDVLAHQGDFHVVGGLFGPVDHGGPLGEVGGVADQAQPPHHHIGQTLPLQHQRDLVEDVGGEIGDGVVHGDVAEEGDLVQNILRDRRITAAHNHVGLNAQGEQFLGGVLGGLGLQLSRAGDGDDEGDMDKHDVLPSPLRRHLADGLQEGLGLDVAHGAADLHDGYVGVGRVQGVDVALDLIGDMGNDLHRAPQIVPRALAVEHVPVHLARGNGGVDAEVFVNEPFVVAQVQIGLRAVVGDEHLPVLIGAHGARVHV